MCTPMHLVYTIPLAHPTNHPKRQLDRFSRFCTADATFSLCYIAPTHSPHSPPSKKSCPSNTSFLGPTWPNTPTASRWSRTFLHNTRSLLPDRRTERTRKSTGTNRSLTLYGRRGLKSDPKSNSDYHTAIRSRWTMEFPLWRREGCHKFLVNRQNEMNSPSKLCISASIVWKPSGKIGMDMKHS